MVRILDLLAQDFEAVGLGRQGRGDGAFRPVGPLRNVAGGAGGIEMHRRFDAQFGDQLAALIERMDVAVDLRQVADIGVGRAEEAMLHPLEMFADNVKAGMGQQVMDVRHPAGDRIIDRDHRQSRFAIADRGEDVLEGRAGQRLHVRINLAAGDVGVRPQGALEGDTVCGGLGHASCSSKARIRARSSGVSTPNGTPSATAASIRHAGFQRAQLFQFFPFLQRARRQADKPGEDRAAPGVDADMVPDRPGAGRGGSPGEVQRPADRGAVREAHDRLDDIRVVAFRRIDGRHDKGGDIDRRFAQRGECGPDQGGFDRGQVALKVDDGAVTALRIVGLRRRVDPVRARRQVRIGHHGLAAGMLDCLGDRPVAAGNDDRSDVRRDRPAPDMDDHRRARNCRKRFVRQPRRGQPGGDNYQRFPAVIGHGSGVTCGSQRIYVTSCRQVPACRGSRAASITGDEISGPSAPRRPSRCGEPTAARPRRRESCAAGYESKGLRYKESPVTAMNFNSFAAAILVVGISAMAISKVGDILVPETHFTHKAEASASAGHGESTAAKPKAPAEPAVAAALAAADAAKGEKLMRSKCKSCHTWSKGGRNSVGPNLWGVVGRGKRARSAGSAIRRG